MGSALAARLKIVKNVNFVKTNQSWLTRKTETKLQKKEVCADNLQFETLVKTYTNYFIMKFHTYLYFTG